MENYYNLIIIGFIVALIVVSMFWAFNAVRRIAIHKNFCADTLTSIAKLWRRAQFIPEDAKERESLYLYRDFLQKVGDQCQFPIILKNGGVRVMTRKEYDSAFVEKPVRLFSWLMVLASVLVAACALWVNFSITKMTGLGIGLALILPVEQIILAFFLSRVVREKNLYRDAIFVALKENGVNFLSITKPYIVVDAYPHKFGKNAKALYMAKGDLKPEQVEEIRGFVMEQKKNEVTAAFESVQQNIVQTPAPQVAEEPQEQAPVQDNIMTSQVAETPVETETNPENTMEPPLSYEEKIALLDKFVDDMMVADIQRAEQAAAENGQPFEFSQEELMAILDPQNNVAEIPAAPEETPVAQNTAEQPDTIEEPAMVDLIDNDTLLDFSEPSIQDMVKAPIPDADTEIVEPDEDDFSLESIGLALDAEIAKRNAKK